jgi:tektin-1
LDSLKKLHEQVVEQLRLNRKAKYNVECDLKDKFNAMSIDEYVRDIDLTNPNIYLKNGAAKIEPQ